MEVPKTIEVATATVALITKLTNPETKILLMARLSTTKTIFMDLETTEAAVTAQNPETRIHPMDPRPTIRMKVTEAPTRRPQNPLIKIPLMDLHPMTKMTTPTEALTANRPDLNLVIRIPLMEAPTIKTLPMEVQEITRMMTIPKNSNLVDTVGKRFVFPTSTLRPSLHHPPFRSHQYELASVDTNDFCTLQSDEQQQGQSGQNDQQQTSNGSGGYISKGMIPHYQAIIIHLMILMQASISWNKRQAIT